MRTKLKRAILICLLKCDGKPMPQDALIGAVQIHVRPDEATVSDVEDALKEVEGSKYAAGVGDDLIGVTWTLTATGTHKARQLR